jgi:hypothetical protein
MYKEKILVNGENRGNYFDKLYDGLRGIMSEVISEVQFTVKIKASTNKRICVLRNIRMA